jgi:ArsR family transcriptional regulator
MKKLPVITPICCAPAIAPVSPEIAERLASQFKALADPTRVGLVNPLAAAREVCVCDLTSVIDL